MVLNKGRYFLKFRYVFDWTWVCFGFGCKIFICITASIIRFIWFAIFFHINFFATGASIFSLKWVPYTSSEGNGSPSNHIGTNESAITSQPLYLGIIRFQIGSELSTRFSYISILEMHIFDDFWNSTLFGRRRGAQKGRKRSKIDLFLRMVILNWSFVLNTFLMWILQWNYQFDTDIKI